MLIPVILSGGAGTRLWPVSREAHPKPFIRLPDGQSLLQKTYLRATGLADVAEVLTVTGRDYYFMTRDEFSACRGTAAAVPARFLLEPCGRNTAPAIALAALCAEAAHGGAATLLVLPADHLILDAAAFAAAVGVAQGLAAAGHLVTFGITPTAAETGFGYIEAGEALGGGRAVLRFVEKPDAARAAAYLAGGRHFWNSGMFCFRADALLAAMAAACPEVLAAARACWQATAPGGGAMIEFDRAAFSAQPDISIDYALMERARGVAVVPCDPGWSDIGSWNALGNLVAPDAAGNRILGEAIVIDARNTFVQSEHHLVAAVGVDDLFVVDTPDAVLVVHKDRTQEVRRVVAQLKQRGHEAYRLHRTVFRPWGTYTVLEEGPGFKIKRIEVKPGASLSLQLHRHRSEHWVVVSGQAKVTNGGREYQVEANASTYVAVATPHRLENPGAEDLVIIEVQSGAYLGEDDIVRLDDVYGR